MGRTIVASAPAKTILLGEHAVVRGRDAIVCSIDKRTSVEVEETEKGPVRLELASLGYSGGCACPLGEKPDSGLCKAMECINSALGEFGLSVSTNILIRVESSVPLGRGMGSSAAFTVALAAALSAYCRASEPGTGAVEVPVDRDRIFELGRRLEAILHGVSSGIDPAASAYSGLLRYSRDRGAVAIERLPEGPFLIVDTNIERSTKQVNLDLADRERRDPERYDRLFSECDDLVRRYCSGDISIDAAMGRNHEILCEMGLSLPLIDRVVELAGRHGLTAKITGAGRGGCVLVHSNADDFPPAFLEEVRRLGCSPELIACGLGRCPGLRVVKKCSNGPR